MEERATRTADGVTLRIDRVPARGRRRGALVCLHAMMTDGRYFGARKGDESFAGYLAGQGIEVHVADFRGHGRSVPPTAGPDDWSFDDLVELDLPAIIAATPPDAVLLGHSLGGLVAAAALATGRIPRPRRLVLAATSVWLDVSLRRHPTRFPVMAAYRGITRLLGKAPIRALRIGTADESRSYVAQLTGWAARGRWSSLGGADYLEALAAIDVPTNAFAGAGDWMCRPADAENITRRIKTCSPLRIVGRAHGDALDPDHFELFTRDDLVPLREWLVALIAGRLTAE
jgi:alpha-beta hydrolase superfamily lysophospholipase